MVSNNARIFNEIDRAREVNPMAAVAYVVAMNGRSTLASVQRAYARIDATIESAGEILGLLADELEAREFTDAADELRAMRDLGPVATGEDPRPGDPGMPRIREIFTEEFCETFDFKPTSVANDA